MRCRKNTESRSETGSGLEVSENMAKVNRDWRANVARLNRGRTEVYLFFGKHL